jgi:adenosylcobinamide kinase / adenosylcobinamide-phosphate guanylyltransferase
VSGLSVVGGGARSGKSRFALELAMRRGSRRVFVATAEPFDDEMRARIEKHVLERGDAFVTVEAPHALEGAVAALSETIEVVVVDCLTLWISNLLLAGLDPPQIEVRVCDLARMLGEAPFRSIVVTNEVGMGIVPEAPLGRLFRDVAGRAHQVLARSAREIYFATMGVVVRLRPGPVEIADSGRD